MPGSVFVFPGSFNFQAFFPLSKLIQIFHRYTRFYLYLVVKNYVSLAGHLKHFRFLERKSFTANSARAVLKENMQQIIFKMRS